MPSWNDLVGEFEAQPNEVKAPWLQQRQQAALIEIGRLRGDRNVLLYASGFLQKPQAPPGQISITAEDLNGYMSVIFGMTWAKGLTLMLHTPGGDPHAAETTVAYVRSKFTDIEVIIPAYAMSAGSMISLAADRIVMGRQSQLGPIDPQMAIGGRYVSARAIVEQFGRAKEDILADLAMAHVWAPALQTIGPSLLQEAQNALDYGELMVGRWLAAYMFKGQDDATALGDAVAKHFNDATTHKSHGRRIDRDEVRSKGVLVEDLESNQALQEAVLTSYHLATILFERSPTTKVLASNTGRQWLKSWAPGP